MKKLGKISTSLISFYLANYLIKKKTFNIKCLPVLLYHDITDKFYWTFSRTTVGIFKRQMSYLKKKGYDEINISNLKRDIKIDEKVFSLTFDDGFESLFENVLPILNKLDYRATVFINTGFMGKKNSWDVNLCNLEKKHMNWDKIEILLDNKWTIGSHSHLHRDYTKISKNEIEEDIGKSIDEIKKNLGFYPKYFSYPFGRTNKKIEDIVKKSGIEIAVTSYPESNLNKNYFAYGRRPVYLFDTSVDVYNRVKKSKWENIPYDIIGRNINFFAGGVGIVKEILKLNI